MALLTGPLYYAILSIITYRSIPGGPSLKKTVAISAIMTLLYLLVFGIQAWLIVTSKFVWNYNCDENPLYEILEKLTFLTNILVITIGYPWITSYFISRGTVVTPSSATSQRTVAVVPSSSIGQGSVPMAERKIRRVGTQFMNNLGARSSWRNITIAYLLLAMYFVVMGRYPSVVVMYLNMDDSDMFKFILRLYVS